MMQQPMFSPFDLQTLGTLAGIANAERISDTAKNKANECIVKLLENLLADATKISLDNMGIVQV
jgi:hypothetical protein